MNTLYFGDNLEIMREHVADECADLIYLDPPFNSNAKYNVLFEDHRTDTASAQAGAFVDTWSWGPEAEFALHEIMRHGGSIATFINALQTALGTSNMMAYLVMMTVRLIEMRRIMKQSSSIYLHCDPTASHYLKIILDAIFGQRNFRTEISWRRTSSHNDAKQGRRQFGNVRDTILFYTANAEWTWNQQYTDYAEGYLENEYRHKASDRAFKETDVTAAKPGGDTSYIWHVKRKIDAKERWIPDFDKEYATGVEGWEYSEVAPYRGRYWAYSKENLRKFWDQGLLIHRSTGMPRLMQYAEDMPGIPLQNDWDDIRPIAAQAKERIGYPTQKPLALLNRIIQTSSNEGDVVFDPFCGCGTTIEAAEVAGRKWIGIDVAIHAIRVIEARLKDRVGLSLKYNVEGIPRDYDSAIRLAERDKYQFQWWANYLFDPHALREQKKGADRGIDGEIYFQNGPGPYGRILTSVKGGKNVGPAMVRDFRGVLERERAEMGLFICLDEPTKAMATEATSAGITKGAHAGLPRMQIVSIAEWFEGRRPDMPRTAPIPSAAFKTRPKKKKSKRPDPNAPEFAFSFEGDLQTDNVVRHFNPARVVESGSRSA